MQEVRKSWNGVEWKIRWEPGSVGIAVPADDEFPSANEVIRHTWKNDPDFRVAIINVLHTNDEGKICQEPAADYCLIKNRRSDEVIWSMVSRNPLEREQYPNWPLPEESGADKFMRRMGVK